MSVLAAYMAGLASGSALAGRLVGRVRRPVLVYGLLELGIAASALAVPWGIRAAGWLHAAVVGVRSAPPDEASVGGALFYVLCSFAILMLPTGMMGATLPLLARHAVREESEIGRRVGALYAINTAGAVAGALVTGFALLPALGLRATIYVGAAVNLLVFVGAAALGRSAPSRALLSGAGAAAVARFHWVLPLVLASGFVSFSYEVIWTRLLGQLLGGSIQAFATMLASFLLGIALGSAVAARLARDPAGAARGFALAQLGAALLSVAAFCAVDWLPGLGRVIGAGRSGSLGANALVSAAGLLPGALCVGAVFPFAVRLLARSEVDAAPATARVYSWNTVGAICGALACGFLLLPALRFADTLRLAAAANLLLALLAAALARPALRAPAGVAALGLLVLALVPLPTPWEVLRNRGGALVEEGWEGEATYYGVGRSSTVLLFDLGTGWRLTTNGLPEARIDRPNPAPDAFPTARWLGMLPTLLRPETRSLLVIGLGGGITLEAVPPTVESVHVIELEPEVVRAHEHLEPLRGSSPLSDPRLTLVVNDARGALMLTDARFEAIVSQPSHPWTAGASHLYTREFFSLAAEHLSPGGVFVQWIAFSYLDEQLLRSLVGTLAEVFPHVAVFQPVRSSVLFAASDRPLDPIDSVGRALARAPEAFARFGLRRVEDVVAGWAIAPRDARRFAEGAPINTDDRNLLATRSPGLGSDSLGIARGAEVLSEYAPAVSNAPGIDPVYLVRRWVDEGEFERAFRAAEAVEDPVVRLAAMGWARAYLQPARAFRHFRRALDLDPSSQGARFGLVWLRRRGLEQGKPEALELAEALMETPAAVAAGWRHAARGDWAALAALDAALAAADPLDPAAREAQHLRVLWRARSERPELRAEGPELAVANLRASAAPRDVLVGAQAFVAADLPAQALTLVEHLSLHPRDRVTSSAALALLDDLPPSVDGERRRVTRRRLVNGLQRRGG